MPCACRAAPCAAARQRRAAALLPALPPRPSSLGCANHCIPIGLRTSVVTASARPVFLRWRQGRRPLRRSPAPISGAREYPPETAPVLAARASCGLRLLRNRLRGAPTGSSPSQLARSLSRSTYAGDGQSLFIRLVPRPTRGGRPSACFTTQGPGRGSLGPARRSPRVSAVVPPLLPPAPVSHPLPCRLDVSQPNSPVLGCYGTGCSVGSKMRTGVNIRDVYKMGKTIGTGGEQRPPAAASDCCCRCCSMPASWCSCLLA